MGNEVKGAIRVGRERHEGKILLETSELIFRGADFRLKVPFSAMNGVKAADRELRIETKDGLKIFEVGTAAGKWRRKILHPKARAEKLGVKPGTRVRLLGKFAADFVKELNRGKAEILKSGATAQAEAAFLAIDDNNSAPAIARYARKMKGAETLWVVYPKGRKEITENDVIRAGRKSGLADVKVVGFSPTHTALKFVLPLGKR